MTEISEMKPTCTKCNAFLVVADINDDAATVHCPECKKEFGKWGDVKVAMVAKLAEPLKDIPWINVTLKKGQ